MFLDFQIKITHNYLNSLNKRSLRLIKVEALRGSAYKREALKRGRRLPYRTKKCRTKVTKLFRGDESFAQRNFFSKIKFYVLASFDCFNTLQIWNIHIGLPSDVKP